MYCNVRKNYQEKSKFKEWIFTRTEWQISNMIFYLLKHILAKHNSWKLQNPAFLRYHDIKVTYLPPSLRFGEQYCKLVNNIKLERKLKSLEKNDIHHIFQKYCIEHFYLKITSTKYWIQCTFQLTGRTEISSDKRVRQ